MEDKFAFFAAVYAAVTNALGVPDTIKALVNESKERAALLAEELHETIVHHIGKRIGVFTGAAALLFALGNIILWLVAVFAIGNVAWWAPTISAYSALALAVIFALHRRTRRNTANRYVLDGDGMPTWREVHVDADGNEVPNPVPGGETIRSRVRHPDFHPDNAGIATVYGAGIAALAIFAILLHGYAIAAEHRGLFSLAMTVTTLTLALCGGAAGVLSWAVRKGASAVERLLQITVEPLATILPDTTSANVRYRIGEINLVEQERLGPAIVKGVTYAFYATMFMNGLLYVAGPSPFHAMLAYGVGFAVITFWLLGVMNQNLRAATLRKTENAIWHCIRFSLPATLVMFCLPFIPGWTAYLWTRASYFLPNRVTIADGWGFWGALLFFLLSLPLAVGVAMAAFKHSQKNVWRVAWTLVGMLPLAYFFIALKTYTLWHVSEGVTFTVAETPALLRSRIMASGAEAVRPVKECLFMPNCRVSGGVTAAHAASATEPTPKTATRGAKPRGAAHARPARTHGVPHDDNRRRVDKEWRESVRQLDEIAVD